MPKTKTVYARLKLEPYSKMFVLDEVRRKINERLYDVLNDDFYLKKLTEEVSKYHTEMEPWLKYQNETLAENRHPTINAVGKFTVMDQRVDLIDIRFY